jgi:hypothetical protein
MNEHLYWSEPMNAVFRDQVVKPVCEHPDTDLTENDLFGLPFELVRDEVICKGRADFSVGYEHARYGKITAEQKLLLYSFINFKKHFYACRRAFETYRVELGRLWIGERPAVIDLGCGPGTAGLALCDSFPGTTWDYVGVDSAAPMLAQTDRMLSSGKRAGLMDPQSLVWLCKDWNECRTSVIRQTAPVLLLCSYLFASASLSPAVLSDLAGWVRSFLTTSDRPVTLLLYLNSTIPVAGASYESFKQLIGLDPHGHGPTRDSVTFLKNRYGTAIGSDEFLHELLVLGGGR